MNILEKKEALKKLGYKVKIKNVSFVDLARANKNIIKVYDGNTLINKGVMTSEQFQKYKEVFDILNN